MQSPRMTVKALKTEFFMVQKKFKNILNIILTKKSYFQK